MIIIDIILLGLTASVWIFAIGYHIIMLHPSLIYRVLGQRMVFKEIKEVLWLMEQHPNQWRISEKTIVHIPSGIGILNYGQFSIMVYDIDKDSRAGGFLSGYADFFSQEEIRGKVFRKQMSRGALYCAVKKLKKKVE